MVLPWLGPADVSHLMYCIYTTGTYDYCFAWKGPCFGGFEPQNRWQKGSRYNENEIINIPTNPTVWIHCATLGYNGHMFNPNNRCENRGFYAKNVVTCHDTSLGSQRNYCILSHFSMPLHATTCNVLAAYYTNPAAFHSFLPPNRPHVFLSSCTPSSQRFLF